VAPIFTGWILFLSPTQQCQSTEGNSKHWSQPEESSLTGLTFFLRPPEGRLWKWNWMTKCIVIKLCGISNAMITTMAQRWGTKVYSKEKFGFSNSNWQQNAQYDYKNNMAGMIWW